MVRKVFHSGLRSNYLNMNLNPGHLPQDLIPMPNIDGAQDKSKNGDPILNI